MAYVDPRLQGKPVPSISAADMEHDNVARLAAMHGSDLAFLDQRIPGYQREIINIIGMGVVENMKDPRLAPKIKTGAHGFAVTYVRGTAGGPAGRSLLSSISRCCTSSAKSAKGLAKQSK
jgi:hypothetical protein